MEEENSNKKSNGELSKQDWSNPVKEEGKTSPHGSNGNVNNNKMNDEAENHSTEVHNKEPNNDVQSSHKTDSTSAVKNAELADTNSPLLSYKSETNDDAQNNHKTDSTSAVKSTELADTKSPLLSRNEKDTENNEPHKSEDQQWSKGRVYRNLVFVGLVWFGVFTAYNALEVLQSSLNPKYGVISISIIYAFKIFTSLFGPLIVRKMTPKWAMFAGCWCHTTYILANFYPVWYTLLPAGVLVGIAMGPLWICLGIYTTVLSVKYSSITKENKAGILSKFNGIVQAVVPLTFLVGNFISSSILQNVRFGTGSNNNSTVNTDIQSLLINISSVEAAKVLSPNNTADWVEYRITTESSFYSLNHTTTEPQCGPHYCPENVDSGASADGPDKGALFVLLAVLGCFNLAGALCAFFGLDNLPKHTFVADRSDDEEEEHWCRQIIAYMKSFFEWRFLMLIPSTVYIHVMLALMSSTFTKAYITCSIGLGMIGYISMARGLTGIFTNASSGIIGQYVNRNIIFGFGILLTITQLCLWLLWDLMPNVLIPLFVSAAIAGIANGANLIQYTAFLGDAFTEKKTEAFSFYHFWAGIAVAIGFLQNNYICVKYQLYIFIGIMILAIITYTILYIYLSKHKKERKITLQAEVLSSAEDLAISFSSTDVNKPSSPHHHLPGHLSNMLKEYLQALSASQISLAMV